MKDFFKFTLATIVGILVTGAVIVGFGIISLIGIWATSETETVVKNNSIYVLEFKGVVSERSQENPFGQLFGDNTTVNGLDDIIESIKKAKENERYLSQCRRLCLFDSLFAGDTTGTLRFQGKRKIHHRIRR